MLSWDIEDLQYQLAHITQENLKLKFKNSVLLWGQDDVDHIIQENEQLTQDMARHDVKTDMVLAKRDQEYKIMSGKYDKACSQLNLCKERILELEEISRTLQVEDLGISELYLDSLDA